MSSPFRGWLIGAAVAAAGVAALVLFVRQSETLPSGVVDIVWDKEACAHCHMHIGDPAFAAQRQLDDGRVLDFDDPGCLFSYELEHPEERVHAVYVHALVGTEWLPRQAAAFVRTSPTPMGFGLGAVAIGSPSSISWAEAQKEVEASRRGRLDRSGSAAEPRGAP